MSSHPAGRGRETAAAAAAQACAPTDITARIERVDPGEQTAPADTLEIVVRNRTGRHRRSAARVHVSQSTVLLFAAASVAVVFSAAVVVNLAGSQGSAASPPAEVPGTAVIAITRTSSPSVVIVGTEAPAPLPTTGERSARGGGARPWASGSARPAPASPAWRSSAPGSPAPARIVPSPSASTQPGPGTTPSASPVLVETTPPSPDEDNSRARPPERRRHPCDAPESGRDRQVDLAHPSLDTPA